MKKSDLKNGMVVETRNGSRYLVCGDMLMRDRGSLFTRYLRDDLTDRDIIDKRFDVVKVYDVVDTLNRVKKTTDLLWQRKEPYKFNERQLEVLAPYRHNYSDWWFAKDGNGDVYVYRDKPIKAQNQWTTTDDFKNIVFPSIFKDYDWQTKPIQIKEIFKGEIK